MSSAGYSASGTKFPYLEKDEPDAQSKHEAKDKVPTNLPTYLMPLFLRFLSRQD